MASEERRRHPRVKDETLSLELNAGGFDTMTHTLNISESGIYCKVDRELPLMSRLKLKLMMPDASGAAGAARGIAVDGVVVREHPVIIDGQTRHYDVAIFFENLPQDARTAISAYIARKKS